jgi:hypothetical protein
MAVAACSTPDLQPMADQTARLAAAARQQNAAVEGRIRAVGERVAGDATASSGTRKSAADATASFAASRAIVDDMVDLAAAYTGELAALAAAGEKGGEAADRLAGTIAKYTALLGYANPAIGLPADLGGTVAGNAIREAARALTRVQAQTSLLATMQDADPAVRNLATALVEIYGRRLENGKPRPMEEAAIESAGLHRAYLIRDFGRIRKAFYEEGRRKLEAVYGDAAKALNADKLDDAEQKLKERATLVAQLAELQPQYDKLQADLAAANDWRDQRIAAGYAIADAANAWAEEHQRLLGWFRKCAGLRVLEAPCGDFSAQNLQAQVERIMIILKGADRAG